MPAGEPGIGKTCTAQELAAHAAELAYHFAEAVAVIVTEKLVRYSMMPGERAVASYAYEEALFHFLQALAAKEGLSPDSFGAEPSWEHCPVPD